MKTYSEYQFVFFRILFGLYLAVHFLQLIPYAGEVFSREGVFADPSLNFFYGLFPNALLVFDTPAGVTLFLGALAVLSFFYAIGLKRRIIALVLWYGWACLFNRNNLISNPSLAYVGWLLLASVVIPGGERLSVDRRLKNKTAAWQMPILIFNGAWILLALGYTLSGIVKLKSPSWVDGTAMMHLLGNPLARDYFLREWFLALPPLVLKMMTWGSLALEVLFAPLCLWRPTRALVWLGIMSMHLGIVTMVNFTDLTLGMFMIHLFTFDSRWLPAKASDGKLPIVFFDGVCGLCNSTVDFFMHEDQDAILKFSPLQGETRKTLIGTDEGSITTIIYLDEKGRHQESSAIIRMLARLGGLWKVIALVIWCVPVFIRNSAYRWVSTNRYHFFGKKDICRMPTQEERARFLS